MNKRAAVTGNWVETDAPKQITVVKRAKGNLGKALLAVVFKVFGVNVDVVPVDAVRQRELGGVLDELLHLHGRLVFTQLFKGPHWYVRRGDAVWRRRNDAISYHGMGRRPDADGAKFRRTRVLQGNVVNGDI